MEENDTISLLKECSAGTKMAIRSMEQVMESVNNSQFRQILNRYCAQHKDMEKKVDDLLLEKGKTGKEPGFMARTMAKMDTELKLTLNPTDAEVADIMTEGCNMGIKSVSRYLNQYESASGESRRIAQNLICVEERFLEELRQFL